MKTAKLKTLLLILVGIGIYFSGAAISFLLSLIYSSQKSILYFHNPLAQFIVSTLVLAVSFCYIGFLERQDKDPDSVTVGRKYYKLFLYGSLTGFGGAVLNAIDGL